MKQKIILIIKVLLFILFFPLSLIILVPKKYKNMPLYVVFLLLGTCYSTTRINRKINTDKTYVKIIEALKNRNILINKDDYKVKFIKCVHNKMGCSPLYSTVRKNYKFKSKYFDNKQNYYLFYNDQITINNSDEKYIDWELKNVIENFGLKSYILDEFIYDKSKGNDFAEIEKIFDSYGKNKIRFILGDIGKYCTDTVNKKLKYQGKEIEIDFNENEEECDKVYKEYWNTPRELNKINWEEYINIHKIYIVLYFEVRGLKVQEEKELIKNIEPYYNKDLMYITFKPYLDEKEPIIKFLLSKMK